MPVCVCALERCLSVSAEVVSLASSSPALLRVMVEAAVHSTTQATDQLGNCKCLRCFLMDSLWILGERLDSCTIRQVTNTLRSMSYITYTQTCIYTIYHRHHHCQDVLPLRCLLVAPSLRVVWLRQELGLHNLLTQLIARMSE